jgi:hypothetical protein
MEKRPHSALGEMVDIVRTFALVLVVNSSFYINEWILHCNRLLFYHLDSIGARARIQSLTSLSMISLYSPLVD